METTPPPPRPPLPLAPGSAPRACAAPDVNWKPPLRSGAALFRSRWFAIGMLVAVGAWALHVAAMAMAPLSLVQAVISGGLVFLTVLAERVFGFKVGRRQWMGVG